MSIKYNNNEITAIEFIGKDSLTRYPHVLLYKPNPASSLFNCVYCKPVHIECTSNLVQSSGSIANSWYDLNLNIMQNNYNLASFIPSTKTVYLSNDSYNVLEYDANYGDMFELVYTYNSGAYAVYSLYKGNEHVGSYALESSSENQNGEIHIPITIDNTVITSSDNGKSLDCPIAVDAYILGPWRTVYNNGSSITLSGTGSRRTVTYKLKIKNEQTTPVWIHNFWCTNKHIEDLFRDAQTFEWSNGDSRSVQLSGNTTTEFTVTETQVGSSIKLGGTFYFSIKDVQSVDLTPEQIKNLRMAKVTMPNSQSSTPVNPGVPL